MTTPQNSPQDSRAEFWIRPDLVSPEKGPFQDLTDELLADMHTFRKDLEPKVIGGDKVLATPEVTFRYVRADGTGFQDSTGKRSTSGYTQGKAFAFTHKVKGAFGKEPRTYMAIDPDTSDPDMYRFLITEDGQLQEIIGSNFALGESAEDAQLSSALKAAVHEISKSLEALRDDRLAEREELTVRIRKVTTVVASLALVGSGIAYGVNRFILQPREEDRIARATYDSKQYVLDAPEIVVTDAAVTTIPKSVMNEIPEWKEDEDLDNPRTVEIKGNSCKTLKKINFGNGDTLLVALAEGDTLETSTVGVITNTEAETIKICLAGPSSEDSDDNNGAVDPSKIAVQLIPRG